MDTSDIDFPSIEAIRANRARLGERVLTTPVRQLHDPALQRAVGAQTRVWLKEELFQHTGSFKPRGALSVMLDLDAAALARGVTGVSAGNHAISLAYCAQVLGTSAKVVMPKSANPFRIQVCRELGAEVELVAGVRWLGVSAWDGLVVGAHLPLAVTNAGAICVRGSDAWPGPGWHGGSAP